MNKLYHGDCFDYFGEIADGSIDMILCDLPYGVTACKWDSVLPLKKLWAEYKRIIKPGGAIVLTATQPFTTALIHSNISRFKYEWIWEKEQGTNFASAKYQPLKSHENITVFAYGKLVYYPYKSRGTPYVTGKGYTEVYGVKMTQRKNNGTRYPKTVLRYNQEKRLHPTQKPVALFAYLIKTYTQEGETVLDNCAGSGTTAIAAIYTGRKCILMEKEDKYIDVIRRRIRKEQNKNDPYDLYAANGVGKKDG